jgi:hypothetical protein
VFLRICFRILLFVVAGAQTASAQHDEADSIVREAVRFLRADLGHDVVIDAASPRRRVGSDTIAAAESARRLGLRVVMPKRFCAGTRPFYNNELTYIWTPGEPTVSGDEAAVAIRYSRNIQSSELGTRRHFFDIKLRLKKVEGRWTVVGTDGPEVIHYMDFCSREK